ncbi:putative uracil permease [Apiospora aurea]|uniref:Uracil permease n=1 Tax=Apiospora aurea TaxID=335848 RepID=A0ABR1QWN2_9PEZI
MVRLPSRHAVLAPFQSAEAFRDFVRAPQTAGGREQIGNEKWSNRDLEPTHPEERTWTAISLPMYWFTNMFSVTGWNVAASLIAVGLTWQQAFISAVLGCLLSSLAIVFMARPGVMYHVGYPIIARVTFGMYGSYFFIFIRAAVCIIWYGVQSFYGANLVSVCFRCIFGDLWTKWPNALPASAHVTSKQLLGFFIVWVAEFPFMFIHPTKIRHLFTLKGVVMPIATFGFFGWAMANGAGLSALDAANKAGEKVAATTTLGWAVMNGINVILGTLSPMLVNQPDLARYCQKPWHAGALQGIVAFTAKVLVLFLGLASTAVLTPTLGKAYWNLWDLLDAILDNYWGPAARGGVFLVSLSFLLAVIATNFGSNSIPFGADLTGLFPKYMTIKRGQVLCAFLGVAVVPWELLASAQAFLSFLGSYNIFMAPLCGVIITDYVWAKTGNYHIPSAYDGTKSSAYWYWGGVNWIAVLAWVGGMTLGLPGLVAQYQPQAVSQAAKDLYKLGWIITFAAACILYCIMTILVRLRVLPAGYESVALSFECMAKNGREGFLDGERDGVGIAASPVLTAARDSRKDGEKISEMKV